MIRGLYTSAGSMVANVRKLDVITNNLANINTNGYKRDIAVSQSFGDYLTRRINDTKRDNPVNGIGNMQYINDTGEIFTVYDQSKLVNTGVYTDMAIGNSDSGFFTIEIPSTDETAREMYTRNGSFAVNTDGELVTQDGYRVLGENGPIQLLHEEFTVMRDGTVIQDGEEVAKLLVRAFENADTLRKHGNNLVESTQVTKETEFTGVINQCFLEESNVNPIKEMVEMINVMRAYEANQKLLKAHDDMLDRAVNEIGVIR